MDVVKLESLQYELENLYRNSTTITWEKRKGRSDVYEIVNFSLEPVSIMPAARVSAWSS